MRIKLDGLILTDEHAASSYGQLVLVHDGDAYGPGDALPMSFAGERAWKVVGRVLEDAGSITGEKRRAAEAFVALGRETARTPGRPPFRENPTLVSFRLSRPVVDRLREEENQTEFVEQLLRRHFRLPRT